MNMWIEMGEGLNMVGGEGKEVDLKVAWRWKWSGVRMYGGLSVVLMSGV